MVDRRWSWAVLAAIGVYFVFGLLLIAQKPGLHYDEAQLVTGAVDLRHSHAETTLAQAPNSWYCKRGYCLPLMAEERYIGAIKEYVCWPLFALFGPHAWLIRLISLVFGAIGIWGVAKFVGEQTSLRTAGVAVALALAVHPAYLDMTAFDNGAVGAMMAGLGLLCAALAFYLDRRTAAAAFLGWRSRRLRRVDASQLRLDGDRWCGRRAPRVRPPRSHSAETLDRDCGGRNCGRVPVAPLQRRFARRDLGGNQHVRRAATHGGAVVLTAVHAR